MILTNLISYDRKEAIHVLIKILATEALFLFQAMQPESYTAGDHGMNEPLIGGAIFTALHQDLTRLPRNSPDFERINKTTQRLGYYWSRMRQSDIGNEQWDGKAP